jgi:ankyrin repeat protein
MGYSLSEHLEPILSQLLAHGADPNIQDKMGRTVAHLLVRSTGVALDDELLEILLDGNADLTIQDNERKRALEAPDNGLYAWKRKWSLSEESQCFDMDVAKAWFALTKTLHHGDNSKLGILLERLPHIDFAGPYGYTALHHAVNADNFEALEVLVNHNADINAREQLGSTPLVVYLLRSREPDLEMTKYLLLHGADPTAWIPTQNTTLIHILAGRGIAEDADGACLQVLQILIEHAQFQVDINCGDSLGNTPFMCVITKPQGIPIAEYLFSKNGDVLRSNHSGETALGRAVVSGNLQMVQFLCNHGAAVSINSAQARVDYFVSPFPDDTLYPVPPLDAAASNGEIEMVNYLLSQGAELDILDDKDRNVIHWAARGGDLEMVKFLIGLGVDHQLKDTDGRTPLDVSGPRPNRANFDSRVEDYLRFGVGCESDNDNEQDNHEYDYQDCDNEKLDEYTDDTQDDVDDDE